MKNEIPKNCLTCMFMDFADDELEELRCYFVINTPNIKGIPVKEDHFCEHYEFNLRLKEDKKNGL